MDWRFWQKKVEPVVVAKTPRRFVVPRGKVMQLARLLDSHNKKQKGQDNESHYLLWEFIEELFEETKEGAWKVKFTTATSAEIVEQL